MHTKICYHRDFYQYVVTKVTVKQGSWNYICKIGVNNITFTGSSFLSTGELTLQKKPWLSFKTKFVLCRPYFKVRKGSRIMFCFFLICNFCLIFFTGVLKSDPLLLPGRNILNSSMALANVGAMAYFMMDHSPSVGLSMLGTTTALSSIMGVTLTAAIGGEWTMTDCCCLWRSLII